MGAHMSRDGFAVALRAAMDRLGLDNTAAARRSGETPNHIGDWLRSDRAISEAKAERILAALEREAPTVASMLDDYERDVMARLRKLRADLLTASSARPAVTAAAIADADVPRRTRRVPR